jgi:hypothetical protein
MLSFPSGKKVALAFGKLSFEEKHALMTGMAKFPDWFIDESLREKYQGSDGKACDGCGTDEVGMLHRHSKKS